MDLYCDEDKALVRLAGFDVREDADQPGRFAWVKVDESGRVVGGCDSSFSNPDDAWGHVLEQVAGETMAYFDLSSEQWDGMGAQARGRLVKRACK